jgi:hypothetical protein
MNDLIKNVHTLFDRGPSLSSLVPSPSVDETMSADTYGSLFLSPELPQPAEVQAKGSTPRLRPELVDDNPASSQLSFSSLPPDSATNDHLTPRPTTLLSPLLGLSSSKTLTEVETTVQEHVIPEARATMSVETFLNSTPSDVAYLPAPRSVDAWWSHQSQPPAHPHPETRMMPQSPSVSTLSSMSGFPLSSATSLQTRMGGFSP